MNKILEQALDTLLTNAVEAQRGVMANENVNDSEKALNVIKAYLTPPTADEVVEELQKYLNYGTVAYEEGNKEFTFTNNGEKGNITETYGNTYMINGFYPSNIGSIIGRFYESLEEEK